MSYLLSQILAVTPSPSPEVDPASTFYSPGVVGFIATFGVTAGAVLIIFDLVRRVRRLRYRAEIEAKLAAEAEISAPAKVKKPAAPAKPSRPASPAKPSRPAPPAKPKRD
ncbi:hypothetical protein [Candidatus Rhodoluna planktonica]|uniref:hypothetical protein n=1 Tax=Candidatus Rhodoluna planktonica TaxID=535712 RepID=UPI0008DA1450|nr:hypothetical protein [Candidatus Rhodoluna planktonica]